MINSHNTFNMNVIIHLNRVIVNKIYRNIHFIQMYIILKTLP